MKKVHYNNRTRLFCLPRIDSSLRFLFLFFVSFVLIEKDESRWREMTRCAHMDVANFILFSRQQFVSMRIVLDAKCFNSSICCCLNYADLKFRDNVIKKRNSGEKRQHAQRHLVAIYNGQWRKFSVSWKKKRPLLVAGPSSADIANLAQWKRPSSKIVEITQTHPTFARN